MKNLLLLFYLLLGMAVQAQIKIGDNPQNIDPSSVLELESTSRVLVITRVNTTQMNAIKPSTGALVYNTDVECIHYYTGTAWINVCDAVAGSLSISAGDGTIVITPNNNAYEIKVGQIHGSNNIIDETILGSKLWDNSITRRKLAPDSVGSVQLGENAVGTLEIINGAVVTSKLANRSVTTEKIALGGSNQILRTNETASAINWVDMPEIQANAITSAQIDDETIGNDDIAPDAAIAGIKITPDFGAQPISTTGTLAAGNTTVTGNINVSGSVFRAAVDLHPDYVFQNYYQGYSKLNASYTFRSLATVEDFVKKHHHLPGVKSAAEVKKDGFWNLSESNLQNLEKIEELFLHTIEQEKKIKELKKENETLSTELKSMKKDLEEIKSLLKKE